MKTICVVAQKGGAGKTTTARNLSVAAAETGKRVCLIDTDPQQSLRQWWDARESDEPKLFSVGPEDDLAAVMQTMRDHFDLCVIDTPPAASTSLQPVLEASDLAIVPVRTSGDDLRAVGATLNLLKQTKTPFVFLLSQVLPRAKVTTMALQTLAQHGRVAPVQVAQRTIYAEASVTGQGVTETTDTRAAEEFQSLYGYIEGVMD
ncbi:ParA family protein [Rubellimicrobium roseum]|uniref:ParA family protein n=1 Tax=Rubellimicrobium roseum TaxID=687525 RepID=UPI00159B94A5|nr:ParA family protein [Rubellimicrobium roseum]